MPELPEIEIMARVLTGALAGVGVESVRVGGVGTLRSFDPPIDSIVGREIDRVGRRGKHLIVELGDLSLLVHLMSAGRLQIFDKKASMRDRTARLLVRLEDGRELRLREFGTRQSAWVKLLPEHQVELDSALFDLGPEAWPDPPSLRPLLDSPRPLYSILRDQKVIAGIGRSWVDEILHAAQLSPFARGDSLTDEEAGRLRESMVGRLGAAIDHYVKVVSLPLPDKMPMPLAVHGRKGEPCPRCATPIEAVHYQDHVMCYCPACQTAGKVLKDRRLSRLLK